MKFYEFKNWVNDELFRPLGFKVKFLSKYDKLGKSDLWDGKKVKERFKPYVSTFLNHPLHIHDYESFEHSYLELFRDGIYRFKADTQTPYIIDCGANIGMSAIYFKMLYPAARITAIEADPHIFTYLQKNTAPHNTPAVTCLNRAVYHVSGKKLLFRTDGGLGGRIQEKADTNQYEEVETIRLKDLLQEPVDFLKMDIEGAEESVIPDCAAELKNVKNLFIEYHSFDNQQQKLQQILQIVQDAGFRYHIKTAYTSKDPFIERVLNTGMDLQLNIICYRQ